MKDEDKKKKNQRAKDPTTTTTTTKKTVLFFYSKKTVSSCWLDTLLPHGIDYRLVLFRRWIASPICIRGTEVIYV